MAFSPSISFFHLDIQDFFFLGQADISDGWDSVKTRGTATAKVTRRNSQSVVTWREHETKGWTPKTGGEEAGSFRGERKLPEKLRL